MNISSFDSFSRYLFSIRCDLLNNVKCKSIKGLIVLIGKLEVVGGTSTKATGLYENPSWGPSTPPGLLAAVTQIYNSWVVFVA